MTRPHGRDDAGRPLDLIGQPLGVRHAPPPQPYIQEVATMAKAERNGVYTLNGLRYIIRAGDVIPEGAELDAEDAEERAKGKAPENKSKQSAPENRAAKGEK